MLEEDRKLALITVGSRREAARLGKSGSEVSYRLSIGGASNRAISGSLERKTCRSSELDPPEMMRDNLRLSLGHVRKLAFEGLCDTGMKRSARLAQEQAVVRTAVTN